MAVDVEQTPEVLEAVTIYPNPASGNQVYVDFQLEKTQQIQISVMDMTGRQIQHFGNQTYPASTPQQKTIPIDGLASGVYLIQLQGEDWVHTEKFVRQ